MLLALLLPDPCDPHCPEAFRAHATEISDAPRLKLVVMDPEAEWTGAPNDVRKRIAEWTRARGGSPRLYPGALVWAVKKPGRELRGKVEQWLAWKRVAAEAAAGTLGSEIDRAELADIRTKVREAADAAREEVWGGYRWLVIADASEKDGLKAIDLGAGHSSSSESLCGRMISALKSSALLNESVGAGYVERNWPPALQEHGAWPLSSLRQSFLDGSLTRLVDADDVLRRNIVEFVDKGDFGLGSGRRPDGTFDRVSFREAIDPADVMFAPDVYLLTRQAAEKLARQADADPEPVTSVETQDDTSGHGGAGTESSSKARTAPSPKEPTAEETPTTRSLRIHGEIPPEIWNRVGTRLLPKLRAGQDLKVSVSFDVTAERGRSTTLLADVRQVLEDLQLERQVSRRNGIREAAIAAREILDPVRAAGRRLANWPEFAEIKASVAAPSCTGRRDRAQPARSARWPSSPPDQAPTVERAGDERIPRQRFVRREEPLRRHAEQDMPATLVQQGADGGCGLPASAGRGFELQRVGLSRRDHRGDTVDCHGVVATLLRRRSAGRTASRARAGR